jgi:hypothetical protein
MRRLMDRAAPWAQRNQFWACTHGIEKTLARLCSWRLAPASMSKPWPANYGTVQPKAAQRMRCSWRTRRASSVDDLDLGPLNP